MKQKLLNSFTWRGTLLVALLSCAFSSAWAGVDVTSTLTFTKKYESAVAADDGILWTVSSDGQQQSFNNTYGLQYGANGSEVGYVELTTPGITGKIFVTKVEVTASAQKDNATLSVTIGGSSLGSTTISTSNSLHEISGSIKCTGNNNNIVVRLANSSFSKKAHLRVKSVKVTYQRYEEFTISDKCYGLDKNNATKYFGTYSNDDDAFVVPSQGVTISTISVFGGVLTLTPLAANTIVPVKTGVLVSDSNPGVKTIILTTDAGTAISDNDLQPSSAMPATAAANTKYYSLKMKNDTDIGFYWGESSGGVFTIDLNKAYLAIDQTGEIKGFSFSDITNGIKTIETEAESKVIYNLAGQRVSKMQKGIYVVNGKKMLVK